MEKKIIFNNTDELLELVKEVYPVSEKDAFWSKSVQLCLYVFGSAACDINGIVTLKDLLGMLSKAYSSDSREYLKELFSKDGISEKSMELFKKFYKNTEFILTGLVLCSLLELKKYLSK